MKVPVYEKQKSLRVTQAAGGQVFIPSRAAFDENQYTRLEGNIKALGGAAALLNRAGEEIAQYKQNRSPNPMEKQNETVLSTEAEHVLTGALEHAKQEATRRERQQTQNEKLVLAQAVAPLASTPEELEKLMEKNFSSSPAKSFLYAQAVGNNINAALAEGQTPQAAQMLARFENYLSPQAGQGARQRLQAAAGRRAAQEVFTQALREGKNPAGWTDKEIEDLSFGASRNLPPGVQQETRLELESMAGAEKARLQKQKASLLGGILQSAQTGDQKSVSRGLYSLAELFPQEDKHLTAAVRKAVASPGRKSNPAVYNRFYKQLAEPDFKENGLAQALEKGEISGSDYLLLMKERAGLLAGEDARSRNLLYSAAQRLCRKEGLNTEESEDFKYAVFSLPGDYSSKLAALKNLRDVYFL